MKQDGTCQTCSNVTGDVHCRANGGPEGMWPICRQDWMEERILNWSLNKRGGWILIRFRRTRITPGGGQWTSWFLWIVTISLSSGATVSVSERTILYRVISFYRVACGHAIASISFQFSTNLNRFELSVSLLNYTLKETFLVVTQILIYLRFTIVC